MKKAIGLSFVFLFLFITVSEFRGFQQPQDETTKQIEQLKKQVTTLEQRIKDLDEQLQKLKSTIPAALLNPNGWPKLEFNGQTFYVIPLGQDSRKTETVIR
jgi:hypothetical protein